MKTEYIKIIIVVLLVTYWKNAQAQQEPLFSQYMFNMMQINPAYAGNAEKSNVTFFHRKQWVGIAGGPVVQSLNLNTPLNYNRVGIGIQVMNESQTIHKRFSANIAYSYKIKINGGLLAFGLYGGLQQSSIDYSKLEIKDQDDRSGTSSSIVPDFGTGLYYHTKTYYVGLSVRHLMNFSKLSEKESLSYRQQIYGTAGYLYHLSPTVQIIPSCLLKYVQGSALQVDLTTHIKYDEKLWLGVSYRSADAVSFQTGINLANLMNHKTYDLKIGYAYDYTFSGLQSYVKGTHELMLSANFSFGKSLKQLKKKKVLVSPLFF